jgi:hypothetical protein
VTGCSKIPYPTMASAALALRAIQRKTAARGGTAPKGLYPCAHCHCWHLTSQPITGHPWWIKRLAPPRTHASPVADGR